MNPSPEVIKGKTDMITKYMYVSHCLHLRKTLQCRAQKSTGKKYLQFTLQEKKVYKAPINKQNTRALRKMGTKHF